MFELSNIQADDAGFFTCKVELETGGSKVSDPVISLPCERDQTER